MTSEYDKERDIEVEGQRAAVYELRMAGMSEADAVAEAGSLASRQATIDALVAALEEAWVYVPENARGTQTKIKAALALARKGG